MIVFCVLSVLLLTFYIREGEAGPIHAVRSGVVTATSPVRYVGSVVASPFNALGNIFSNLTASQETLSDLKQQNAELTGQVAQLAEAKETAERLEGLLGLQSTYNLQSTAARIIGGSSDAWSQTVTIDKGSLDGFEIGMPVCNAYGVIGQITEVALSSSTVLLINDETSGVSAMVQSSRAQGMLRGQADGSLRLEYVSTDYDVQVGDIVITSGLGGVFPKGLPLGTVSSVERRDNDVYYDIVVRTSASTENNEEVLVITALSDDQRATDEDIAAANDIDSVQTSTSDGDSQESDQTGEDGSTDGQDSSDTTDESTEE
ncbi:rod shape-determining protein MreC [Collinsella ihumii]|uniref:Cell shape-determining protein MreC n=1 Tax=Collinsella ihumii TaxID=1720204 RepID=A0AAW7JL68_9ACTN|nr:rod shape-determining protein MreC [Collinsella ihumii]MBM6775832.1 rod shape-determining protein MreC [Collinsella tanakaei]MBM6904972.1 rod shape-determining protein MreC [Collinsella tanakaei]MCF6412736.1 rod shape-determining protein MreC [Collinsella tanakaei]MDN0068248.1 rod shape-determining protein MreC [Collinsella ihumii]